LGANWSTGSVPGSSDNAVINTNSAATITVQAGDSASIQSLTTGSNDTLSFSGGSVTLAGNSTLSGALKMTAGTLTANGYGISVAAAGTTTISGSSLYAEGGATLSLPGLTSYTGSTGQTTTLEATGAISTLNLANLTSVTVDTSTYYSATEFEALAGGTVNLSGLTQLNTGIVVLESDGTGSVLNISALTSITTAPVSFTGNVSTLQVSDAGTVIESLTSLTNVAVTVGGTTGSGMNLSWGLTSINGSNVTVSGGASLSLPSLTSYTGRAGYTTTLEATGTGSKLALAGLTSVMVDTTNNNSQVDFEALSGGMVNLSSLNSFTSGRGGITVNSSGSLQYGSNLFAVPAPGNGQTINVPQLPTGVPIYVGTTGTYSGGTTFNVSAGDDIRLTGGTFTGGVTFNLGTGATVDLTGGNTVTYSGLLTDSGSGTVQFSSGGIDTGLGGLSLNFAGNTFQWTGGAFFAALGNVTNLGTLNLAGSNDKGFYQDAVLDNFGTIIQTGSGNLGLHSDNVTATTLKIEPGASYLIGSDSGIDNPFGGATAVINQGTIRKTAGTGTSTLYVPGTFSNTGNMEADSGTLFVDANSISELSGTTLIAGTWKALGGSTLEFPNGSNITNNQANVALAGSGAAFAAFAGLAVNSGSFSITNGANFTATGNFTNSGTLTVGAGSTLTVPGTFTQTSTGILNVQVGGGPSSGQYGQVKVSGATTLAGNFGVSLVNGFNATVGQAFQPLTFSSLSGGFNNFTGLAPTFTEALNATNLTLNATNTSIDLSLASVTAPAIATAGQSITVNWEVTNLTNLALTGSWLDSVYLSPTPSLSSSSILLGSKQEINLAANHSYGASLAVPLTTVPPGFYYVLVKVDSLYQVPDPNRANNSGAASGQINVSLPILTLGTAAHGSFTAADQDQYYQVTVPAGGALTVSLSSSASSGALALCIGQGTLPTAANNQGAAAVATQPNQTLIVPQVLSAGTYYILVHSISGTAATANYSLTVTQTSALTVTAISSYAGGNAGNVTIEIDGTNFTTATTATLTLGGTTINASAIDFVNAGQLFATFNLTGAAAGAYTLKVRQGSNSATAPTPFTVVVATAGTVTLNLSVPQFVRSGRTGIVVISYSNTTNNDIIAPFLTVSSDNPLVLFSTSGNPNDFIPEVQLLAVAPSGPAGILRPGQSGQLTLILLNNDPTDGADLPVDVSPIPAGQSIDWAEQQASLQPSTFSAASWNVVFSNLLGIIGSTTDSYNAALAQAATYLSGLGENTDQTSSVDNLWSFLLSQANAALPSAVLASAVDAALPTPGNLTLALDRAFLSTIADRNQPGLFGLGWSTSWDMALSVDAAGNVSISSGGDFRYFVAQANGTYLDTVGEYGTLTQSGGIFTYTDTAGTQYVFLTNGKLNYTQDTNGNRITLGYNTSNQLTSLTYSSQTDSSAPTATLTLVYLDRSNARNSARMLGEP
jgi:hypothetical protein